MKKNTASTVPEHRIVFVCGFFCTQAQDTTPTVVPSPTTTPIHLSVEVTPPSRIFALMDGGRSNAPEDSVTRRDTGCFLAMAST